MFKRYVSIVELQFLLMTKFNTSSMTMQRRLVINLRKADSVPKMKICISIMKICISKMLMSICLHLPLENDIYSGG